MINKTLVNHPMFQSDDAKLILNSYLGNDIADMQKAHRNAAHFIAKKAIDEFRNNRLIDVPQLDTVVKQNAQDMLEKHPNKFSIWSETQCKVRIPVFPDEA